MKNIYITCLFCFFLLQAKGQSLPGRAADANVLFQHQVFISPGFLGIREKEPTLGHLIVAKSGMGYGLMLLNAMGGDTLQLYDDAHRLLGTWHEDPKGAPTRIHLQAYPPGLYTLLRRSKGVVYRLEVERKM